MTLHDPPATDAPSPEAPCTCASCGAEISAQDRYCWLCGGKIVLSAASDASLSIGTPPLSQPLTNRHAAMFWLVAIVAAVVGYGMLRSQDRRVSALYLMIIVPALYYRIDPIRDTL